MRSLIHVHHLGVTVGVTVNVCVPYWHIFLNCAMMQESLCNGDLKNCVVSRDIFFILIYSMAQMKHHDLLVIIFGLYEN